MPSQFGGIAVDEAPQEASGSQFGGIPVDNQPTDDKGFIDRVSDDYNKRKGLVADAANAYNEGKQSYPETVGQTIGKGIIGFGNDVIGNALGSAGRYIDDATPDFIAQPVKQGAKDVFHYISDSAAGDLARDAISGYKDFAQNNPRAARNVEAVGNAVGLATTFTPIKGTSAAGAALDATQALGRGALDTSKAVGDALVSNADNRIINRNLNAAEKLVMPDSTKKQAIETGEVARTSKSGILGTYSVDPNAFQQKAIEEVANVPGFKAGNTATDNYQAISKANQTEAENLSNYLKKNDVAVPDDTIINNLTALQNNLTDRAKYPFITGNIESATKNVLDSALQHISNNPQTASGLLQARKDFDKYVKASLFEPEISKPINTVIQQTRQTLNQMVSDAVPSAEVKASLAKQNALFEAQKNIEPKALKEAGTNRVGRLATKVVSALPGESTGAKAAYGVAGATGIGGAALTGALPLVAGAAGLYQAGKAAVSPTMERVLGKLLGGGQVAAKDIGELSPQEAPQILNLIQQTNGMNPAQLRAFIEQNTK